MSAVRLGINGFGRIGRLTTRAATTAKSEIAQVTAINDPNMDLDYLIYLLKYDSVHGRYEHEHSVKKVDGGIEVNGKKIRIFSEKDPASIPWGDAGADYICESTGVFTAKDKAAQHLKGGAKKVIISAPPKDDVPIYVVGVNHKDYKQD